MIALSNAIRTPIAAPQGSSKEPPAGRDEEAEEQVDPSPGGDVEVEGVVGCHYVELVSKIADRPAIASKMPIRSIIVAANVMPLVTQPETGCFASCVVLAHRVFLGWTTNGEESLAAPMQLQGFGNCAQLPLASRCVELRLHRAGERRSAPRRP